MQTVDVEIQGTYWRLSLPQEDCPERWLYCYGSEGRKKLLQIASQRDCRILAVHFDASQCRDRQAAVDLTVCMAERGWAVCLCTG